MLREEDGRDRELLEEGAVAGLNLEGGGILVRMFKRVFKFIDRPWKMYPLGVLFGLGFDTSSEVAVLAIASIQGAQGTSIWLILIFPILFTGTSLYLHQDRMCLTCGSWNVFNRHHGWCVNDDALHIHFPSSRYGCHPLLFNSIVRHNSPCSDLHRHHTTLVSDI